MNQIKAITRPLLTLLTDPMPVGADMPFQVMKRVGRQIKYTFVRRTFSSHPRFRGHFAVTRSLVEGMEKIGANFNYGPTRLRDVADNVVVLAGVRTLQQAIDLKRKGVIKKLYAGPNIVVFSSDYNSLIASSEIDYVITPSNLVSIKYIQDNPSLLNRTVIWPAGVDTTYWIPDRLHSSKNILFFVKTNKSSLAGPVTPYVDYIKQLGYSVEVFTYGTFNHANYLKALQKSQLMVGFTVDESQGLAWAEAWSVDVPTLLWKNEINTHRGKTYKTSTAPYLTQATGLFFDNFDDFKDKFMKWEKNPKQFSPRNWVLENMSDEVAALKLYQEVVEC